MLTLIVPANQIQHRPSVVIARREAGTETERTRNSLVIRRLINQPGIYETALERRHPAY